MLDAHNVSRRKFLQYTGALTGAATLSLAVPASAQLAANDTDHQHTTDPAKPLSRGRMFFARDLDFDTLSDACERIFPKDETGPGAVDLAVPYFIDNQLAGAYGYNAREYTFGPWGQGAPTQGYQTPLLRREVFLQGIQALNDYAGQQFGKNFPDLTAEQQDQVLTDCQGGKLPTRGFTSGYFFSLLQSLTMAGAYADPIYNGNNNMDGWRMKQYPGSQMSYIYLMTAPSFMAVEPASLAGMH